jgi:adenylate cyclase
MRKTKYQDFRSFSGKVRVAFSLLSIIPFGLIIYLAVQVKLELSQIVILFVALVLVSFLAGFSLIRQSADFLRRLSRETREMRSGEKNRPISFHGDEELEDIAANFNSVFDKFQASSRAHREQSIQLIEYARDLSRSHKKSREEEDLRKRLSRYVGSNLVEKLAHSKNGLFPENERTEVTVLFADIRSFTAISERLSAEDVVVMLNQFFEIMVDIVFAHHGVLDKFVGDQIVAIFGLVTDSEDGPLNAIQAAVEMQAATLELAKDRFRQNQETFDIGIGINTGEAIVGNIGSKNRMDYTVIGDSVNVAARLQQIAGKGEIVAGHQTYKGIKGGFQIDKRIKLKVKNRAEPVICYKVGWRSKGKAAG